jgi:esterase
MELALTAPERVGKLIVADIAPVTYTEQHLQILKALQQVVDWRCETRTEAEALLCEVIEDPGVVGYLLMSLEQADGIYRWRFNLTGLADGYGRLRQAPSEAAPFQGPTLFLKGGNSAYIQAAHEQEIRRRFPGSQLVALQGAGHWLHVDQPDQFNDAVRTFLLATETR